LAWPYLSHGLTAPPNVACAKFFEALSPPRKCRGSLRLRLRGAKWTQKKDGA
jgi:hypothetical protein